MSFRALAYLIAGVLPVLAAPCAAGVGPELAAKLGGELTPLGGLRAGNATGSIPVWSGTAMPAPTGEQTPLFVVDRSNMAHHLEQLSGGQRALLETLPESYALPVYASYRQAAAPAAFVAGTFANATKAFIESKDMPPQAAVPGIPFPILSSRPADAGLEAIWNQRLRWRGSGRLRTRMQITSSTRGDLGVTRVREQEAFRASDNLVDRYGAILGYTLRGIIEPKRLAGTVKLVYDPLSGPPAGWQRSPKQPKFEKTGSVGDDTVVIGSEGLLNEDQVEGFAGSPLRYDWKLLGTRELLVPYDAVRFEGAAPDDIFGPRHIRPNLARYELHRVHVLEARLKPQLIAPFARRVLYLDEDSWTVLAVDLYDRGDRLVRVQEVHTRIGDGGLLVPTLETVYDLPGKRYFAAATTNRDGLVEFPDVALGDFAPTRAMIWARRAGIVPPEDRGER